MLSQSPFAASLGLLALVGQASASPHRDHDKYKQPESSALDTTTVFEEQCTANVTVFDTTTIVLEKTVPVTHYLNLTSTTVVEKCITKEVTTTLYHTVDLTETDVEKTTLTETEVETDSRTLTEIDHETLTETDYETLTETDHETLTETDHETITETDYETVTQTESETITTFTTTTVLSTVVDPCPSTCSVSAAVVTLFFWPLDRPYTYPSTYYDPDRDYTFTSPSVYMIIPEAQGTNASGPVGPSTTDWILPLDLEEVSTIADGRSGSITRQLTLGDLGTQCPQSRAPEAIATLSDSACAPILAAPEQVTSWAYPCNACGPFGLFDPPYAVPTITGGLIETTTVIPEETTTVIPVETTTVPAEVSSEVPDSSIVEITSTVEVPPPAVTSEAPTESATTTVTLGDESSTLDGTTGPVVVPTTSLNGTVPPDVITASAAKSSVTLMSYLVALATIGFML